MISALASCSIISLCATWGGPLAIVFALIGIIIFVIWYFTQDHRSPTEKFLDDRVGPAGLRMPGDKQAPEYFNVVPTKDGKPSLVGLAIKGPVRPMLGPIMNPWLMPDESKQKYIKLDVANKSVNAADNVDYSLDTIWSFETRMDGRSFIYTAELTMDKTPNADGIYPVHRKLWYISTSDDYQRLELREMPGLADAEKEQRKNVQEHALWTVDVLEKPTQDTADHKDDKGNMVKGHVTKAVVRITQKDTTNNVTTIGRWYEKDKGFTTGPALWKVSTPSDPNKVFIADWVMSMQPIGPSDFYYMNSPWKLNTKDRVSTSQSPKCHSNVHHRTAATRTDSPCPVHQVRVRRGASLQILILTASSWSGRAKMRA